MIFIQYFFSTPHSIPHAILQPVRLLVNLKIKLTPLIVKIHKSKTTADRGIDAQFAGIQDLEARASCPAKTY